LVSSDEWNLDKIFPLAGDSEDSPVGIARSPRQDALAIGNIVILRPKFCDNDQGGVLFAIVIHGRYLIYIARPKVEWFQGLLSAAMPDREVFSCFA
jgi:hypothetical protein